MKRALLFVLLAFTLTGCAVRSGYYGRDRYWRDHDRHEYREHHGHHRDRDDRWR